MATTEKQENSKLDAPWHLSRERLAHLGSRKLANLIMEEVRSNDRLKNRILREVRESGTFGNVGLVTAGTGVDSELHFVGNSSSIRQVFESIRKFAVTDLPVLITGESGTGKELVAAAIHERSGCANGPFVPVNCGGIPESLIASEMFGYEKGAFTGASQRKLGRIEAAEGGTLFLDEIGDLPPQLQGHLLRFLQEGTVDRVGSQRPVPVNVRVIAATNRDLKKAVEDGDFRLDLYYRLNVLHLHLPPLRERDDDIELLSKYFLGKFNRELQTAVNHIAPDALEALRRHTWPGNVRELISALRRAVVMAQGDTIHLRDLDLELSPEAPVPEGAARRLTEDMPANGDAAIQAAAPNSKHSLMEMRERTERNALLAALVRNRHNVTRTAKELGVSRVTLYRLMEKYELRNETRMSMPSSVSMEGWRQSR